MKEENPKPVHYGIICDICEKQVVGIRYKCLERPDYDLCEECNSKESGHLMLKIPTPQSLTKLANNQGIIDIPIPGFFPQHPPHHRLQHPPYMFGGPRCGRGRGRELFKNLVHLVTQKNKEEAPKAKPTYKFTGEEKAGDTISVEVGPVWSHNDYLKRKDEEWANLFEGWALTGHWWTTIPGKMSVVQYIKKEEASAKKEEAFKVTYNFTGEEKAGDCINVEVGPVWSHNDYLKRKDEEWANLFPGWKLTGHWWTTVAGKMSVVQYKKQEETVKEEKKEEEPVNFCNLFADLKKDAGNCDFKSIGNTLETHFKDDKNMTSLFEQFFTNPMGMLNNVCGVIDNIGKTKEAEKKEEKIEEKAEEKVNESTEVYEEKTEETKIFEDNQNLINVDDDAIFHSAKDESENEENLKKEEELNGLRKFYLDQLKDYFPNQKDEVFEKIIADNKNADLGELVELAFTWITENQK